MDGILDWNMIVNHLVEIIVTMFMAIILPWVIKRLNVSIDDQTRGYVEQALRGGLKYAIEAAAAKRGLNVAVVAQQAMADGVLRQELVTDANAYVEANVAKGVTRLKMREGEMGVREILSSRVIDVATEISQGATSPIPG